MKDYSKYMLSICVASLLLGCGSSSSNTTPISVEDGNENPNTSGMNTDTKKETVTLNGIAVDDLIINGVVKVYSSTTPRVLLAEGRTDPVTGAYTLDIDYDGVVVLDVTGDEQSLMKNPDTGVTQPCESDLLLQSAAVLTPNMEELEVNISPLTDLVVSQMAERGGSQEDLEAAQDNIGQIFGFDPLGDSPINNEAYKKTVGAIRDLADQKGVTMVEIIDQINEDMVDGQSGDDGDIARELAAVMEDNGVVNTFTENDGNVAPEEDAEVPPEPVVPPVVPPTPVPSQSSDIQASKTFFNNLRTQAMSVVDYDDTGNAGFLDSESEALGAKVENMALNIGLVTDYSIGIVGLITEAIDEGDNSKHIDMDDSDDDDCDEGCAEPVPPTPVLEKIMQKGEEPLVTRTLDVTKTSDPKVWTYRMEDNTTATYTGTVTLPDANVSSITASNFTSLVAKFDGKLPLRYMDSTETAGEQTVKLDLEITKSAAGANLELKELSIKNGSDSVAVKTLKGSVVYEHDTTTDEVSMESVELETITLKATVENYLLEGKLDITEYVTNSSIASRGFEDSTVEYQTEVRGHVRCAGEHNEWVSSENRGGNVIYTDQSSVEHTLPIHNWGDFYERFEGNIQALGEGERIDEHNWDNNYTNYLGLSFDNISISSGSCSNILLEDVGIHAFEDNNPDSDTNRTDMNIRIFCVNDGGERSEISDATGIFTDAQGVNHTFDAYENNSELTASCEGNTEGIVFDSGHAHFDTFDRIAISEVNFECSNPHLEYLNIGVQPLNEDASQLFTYLQGGIKCDDDSRPTQATVIYTDKSGDTHTLIYRDNMFHDDGENAKIIGNVEELEMNMGDENYHAIGNALPATPMLSVQGSTCPNPIFEQYQISLDADEDGDIYNSGVLPKKAKFVGSIKNTVTSGEIRGELNVEWKNAGTMDLTDDSEDKAELDITLQGKIKMPSRPEMVLNLGYANPTDANNYSLSYQYGTTALNGTASFDAENENGEIEFTGTNGIKLVVKKENAEIQYGTASPVTRNGRKIGELQERAGVPVISYVDGTFESLP